MTELNPWPVYIQERLALWDRLKKEADEALAGKVSEPIQVCIDFINFSLHGFCDLETDILFSLSSLMFSTLNRLLCLMEQ